MVAHTFAKMIPTQRISLLQSLLYFLVTVGLGKHLNSSAKLRGCKVHIFLPTTPLAPRSNFGLISSHCHYLLQMLTITFRLRFSFRIVVLYRCPEVFQSLNQKKICLLSWPWRSCRHQRDAYLLQDSLNMAQNQPCRDASQPCDWVVQRTCSLAVPNHNACCAPPYFH